MSPSIHHAMHPKLTTLLCCFGICVVSNTTAADSASSIGTLTQIGRYSEVAVRPTAGQRDLLSVTTAITIPNEIESVGDALRWILGDSGYRLAADPVLTEDVLAMLELPLPAVHRRFEPMPLKSVMALMVGPTFHIVQDPVHRLIAFERCRAVPDHSPIGEAP